MTKKLLLLIFVLAAGSVGFWYFQRNVFSKEILKLEILGPETVDVGEPFDYVVKYKNNGEITLTNPRLVFEYPSSSLAEGEKLRLEKNLDDIYPGKEETMVFPARLLGKERELKIAKAWLEFQPKNLKARYEVSTTQSALLKFSPLTFEFDFPSRLETEKDFSLSLNYFSNIDYPLLPLRLRIDYPSGFEFISSNPRALEGNEWQLPVLNKAQGGRINVFGRLKGGVGEQKVFKASLGLWQENGFVLLKETTKGAEITKPNIYLSQMVNGSLDYIANSGDSLHYEIFFKNVGTSSFENLFLVVQLDGEFFDFESLRAEGANFHRGDSSLLWDWKKNPQLRFLGEGEEGKVDFWIELKKELLPEQKNKNLVLKNRASISPASEEFTIKVNSKLVLEQQLFFDDEVFGNSGPLPPRPGEETTYTIIWRLKNSYNDLRDVKVKAILPERVSLPGNLFPRDASFAFDSESREIIWQVGDLAAFQGMGGEAKSLAFQISFNPDSWQRGEAPELIGKANASAEDTWTRETITAEAGALNTTSLADKEFTREKGIVQ